MLGWGGRSSVLDSSSSSMSFLLPLSCLLSLALAFPFNPFLPPPPPARIPVKTVSKAVVVLRDFNKDTSEAVDGILVFSQLAPNAAVKIKGEVTGLKEGLHGFHIHEFGNFTDGCMSAGSHFNPSNSTHGGPNFFYRHAGDLGNIKANKKGIATVDIVATRISLFPGTSNIVGRGLVIHAGKDDLGLGGNAESLKTGNAGARVSCGIIAVGENGAPPPLRIIGTEIPKELAAWYAQAASWLAQPPTGFNNLNLFGSPYPAQLRRPVQQPGFRQQFGNPFRNRFQPVYPQNTFGGFGGWNRFFTKK